MKTKPLKTTPKAPNASGPTMQCPECGAAIPIADAVEQAVSARTVSAQEAETRFRRQEAQLKANTETRLRELENQLQKDHACHLEKLQTEHREDRARFHNSLAEYSIIRDREVNGLRKLLDEAKAEATQKFQEGRATTSAQMKTLQTHLEKAQAEQAKAREALAAAEAKAASAQFDQRAAFEKGRTEALQASQRQMLDLQKLLDEVRTQALKREKDLDKRLAQAIQEAEARAAAQGARKQKADLEGALEAERARVRKEVAREHAVEQQGQETQIQRLRQEIEALHRKAESGPSEVIGDAAEEVLERDLRDAFQADGDTILRTRKGQSGADFLITVPRAGGRKVLLESKWTQTFDKGWLAKAREDRKNTGAEVVVIVSRTMPTGVELLAQMGDVWVTSHRTVLALVTALRQGLIAVERARRAASMDEARVNAVKAYLSGPAFRQQVEQVVTLAAKLDEGLTRERTQHERAWKEGHAAFERILSAAIGIWTDLEIHSGQGLSPSEVMKPYLKAEEPEPKPKRRSKAA
jgi:hypothetical protein